jgi:hypothetical protein
MQQYKNLLLESSTNILNVQLVLSTDCDKKLL